MAKDLKTTCINAIIEIEGGYVNDPYDSGGETKFGITVAVARAWGYSGPMVDLPRAVAFEIYEHRFWKALSLDEVCTLSPAIANEVADTAVNMGQGRSARFLQRALNVMNRLEHFYDDLVVDGLVGPASINALKSFLAARPDDGELVLVNALNCLQGAKYIDLAERREKDESFIFGWFKHRVSIT